ncbi:hypothetical protein BAY61_14765 [Prauserella marina]|uniref:Uncharacterized protein n=1 Tax=Prauserella marina TaxID=530584 RepID=A0A222VQ64_9PSEU|nr:VOC family protein [Prauserella marina]ASR36055.1 hypothetical protein BAY61_14765 [Prauserella marina]PWV83987.1 hypothetical protein DES30_1014 [Prauserella marina]SDC33073.1 hypothetical protein SAMN05421630_1011333 [Prauserella marina]
MGTVIHVEITADDTARAAEFYSTVLGWRSSPSPVIDGYLLADSGDGGGIDAAIMRREYQPQPAIAWVEVADLAEVLAAVPAAGGSTLGDTHTIPGEGMVAYIKDSEGNVLGLKQPA